MTAFLQTYIHPTSRIRQKLNVNTAEQVERTRRFLTSIIRCIEYCGRQGSSRWGHKNNATSSTINCGNLRALLDFCIVSEDTELKAHLETGAKNAQHISKTAQNEFLICIKEYTQEAIVKEVQNHVSHNGVACYALQADEVLHESNVEQLGVGIRYIKENTPVKKLIEFVESQEVTGAAIWQKLIGCLEGRHMNPDMCRAQTYDGAGNMAGEINGCAANFRKAHPREKYYHCASYGPNLALCKASQLQGILNMIGSWRAVGLFFK